jgi:orotidine-5'-phosphate decarboxylase
MAHALARTVVCGAQVVDLVRRQSPLVLPGVRVVDAVGDCGSGRRVA